jgi:phosphoribosylanthranilate isomerase
VSDWLLPAAGAGGARGAPRTRIKICGVTARHIAEAAAQARADAIGLVFAAGSPRHVSTAQARAICRALPPALTPVAVFRDQSRAAIEEWPGEWVQLHGHEDEQEAHLPRRVIKAIAFDEAEVLRWDACPHLAALLIEGSAAGSGRAFDHATLGPMMRRLRTPVILAGGLTAANVGAAIAAIRPVAVDVSSGVESARGVKEPTLIAEFCQAVREADEEVRRET